MKTRVKVYLGVIGAGVALWGGLLLYPPARYATEARQIREQQQQRLAARQAMVGDASKNAFLEPTLASYWGPGPSGGDAAVRAAIGDMRDFGALGSAQTEDVSKLLASRHPKFLAAVTNFAKLYPKLHEVARLPHFIVPLEKLDLNTRAANHISFRSLISALSAYAEVLVAQGHPDQAAQVVADQFRFVSQRTGDQNLLSAFMLQLGAESVSLSTSEMLLGSSGTQLKPDSLALLAETLQATQLPKDGLADSLETEFVALENTLDLPETELAKNSQFQNLAPFYTLPGIRYRDRKIFENHLVPRVLAARAGAEQTGAPDSFSWADWVTGQQSMASSLIGTTTRLAQLQSERLRLQRGFQHLWAHVLSYRSKHHALPKDLQTLQADGYKPMAALAPQSIGWENSEAGVSLSYALPKPVLDVAKGREHKGIWPRIVEVNDSGYKVQVPAK